MPIEDKSIRQLHLEKYGVKTKLHPHVLQAAIIDEAYSGDVNCDVCMNTIALKEHTEDGAQIGRPWTCDAKDDQALGGHCWFDICIGTSGIGAHVRGRPTKPSRSRRS